MNVSTLLSGHILQDFIQPIESPLMKKRPRRFFAMTARSLGSRKADP
jgi:hypothetical protein